LRAWCRAHVHVGLHALSYPQTTALLRRHALAIVETNLPGVFRLANRRYLVPEGALMRLLVLVSERVSEWISKGAVVDRYFNPGDFFDEVPLVLTNDDVPDPHALQRMAGRAAIAVHNVPYPSGLFAMRTLGLRHALLRLWARAAWWRSPASCSPTLRAVYAVPGRLLRERAAFFERIDREFLNWNEPLHGARSFERIFPSAAYAGCPVPRDRVRHGHHGGLWAQAGARVTGVDLNAVAVQSHTSSR
jgi:hypothetical protein